MIKELFEIETEEALRTIRIDDFGSDYPLAASGSKQQNRK